MTGFVCRTALVTCVLGLSVVSQSSGQISLLATADLTQSRAGENADLSGLNNTLENGAPANLLGGLGSALAYASGRTFLALPDRGPNAVSWNAKIDDTASYINRFHTIQMQLVPNNSGTGLPYTLTPRLHATTLLWNRDPLVYGTGSGFNAPSGAPALNTQFQHFFTGRSDNFDPATTSGNPLDARFDTEGMRVSNDGASVFISDEYGPFVYQFNRSTGERMRTFQLPDNFFVPKPAAMGANEIANNTVGRTANKGMEGLAITPDGTTLVGIMQTALLQDANEKDAKGNKPGANLLRIATIDIASGKTTHQYAYLLTTGSGVSEILALNDHEFLVDERDGRGREGGDNLTSNDARVKQLFKIDLAGAVDVSAMDAIGAVTHAVSKTLFLDLVKALVASGIPATHIPSKIEGIAFGPDLHAKGKTIHTLWVANDNDFVTVTNDVPALPNPSQFFVFGFTDTDLQGSKLVPQFSDDESDNSAQGQ